MSAVRVRHRPPAFALRATAWQAKRSEKTCEGCRVGVVLRRSVCVDGNNGDGRVHRVMKYVYIINSLENSDRFYVGITGDLKARLAKHNAKEVTHTSKFAPWKLKTYIAFDNDERAFAFEKYLKSASGRAFAKKRF